MSALLSLREVCKSFGATALFSGVSLHIAPEERVGLIGANGSGKSTLLRIMAGLQKTDAGERSLLKNAIVAYLPQDDELPTARTVEEVVAQPLRDQARPESEIFTRVGVILGKAGFTDRNQAAPTLSGGWRKRLALARELVKEPDVLLLDEPTNHLDLESILWLEKFLLALRCAFVVVSHDRYFLENVTNRTIELGRNYPDGFFSVNAPYSAFLERREEFRQGRAGYEQALAGKVRSEIEWLRRGPKARTTKAKFRIEEAGKLQEEFAATRRQNAQAARAGIDFTGTDRKTKRLLVAKGIAKSLGEKTLFSDLDIVLSPKVRVGLVGLNGSGKTSLIRVLAGEIPPDAGSVTRAPGLDIVVFDQDRAKLDTSKSLRQALAPAGDSVIYRERAIHVASWAKRFLFKPEQLGLPVSELSGGEQARILIAQLMLQPADLLLLDEPTNNLDIQTLEVLEESLLDFPGAVVLITHDRYLLDRISNVVLGLDGAGGAEVFADYAQWDATRKDREKAETARPKAKTAPVPKSKSTKLSYHEQREWDAMETRIQEAEDELAACATALKNPDVAADAAALQTRLAAFEQAQREVDKLYARWEELEAKQQDVG